MARLTSREAHAILARCKVNPHVPFHALSPFHVDALLTEADARRYRKPKNANGSRGRYFHAYVVRALRRDE
jgi:hypothetical protein